MLYVASGLFGTLASTIFLPGVISVGASASVFGLIGAYWADVLLNYCAKCTLRDTGFVGLLLASIPNFAVGFTPWVDNFMHLGGFVSGGAIGCLLLPQIRANARVVTPERAAAVAAAADGPMVRSSPLGKRRRVQAQRYWQRAGDKVVGDGAAMARMVDEALRNTRTSSSRSLSRSLSRSSSRGRAAASAAVAAAASSVQPAHAARWLYARACGKLNRAQKAILADAALILFLCVLGASAASSSSVQQLLRSCSLCKSLNCIEIDWFTAPQPWWSCCLASLPGSCVLELHETRLHGVCNLTGLPIFNASCELSEPSCAWAPGGDPAATSLMCQKLCFDC